MSGHAHIEELTELELHGHKLCNPSFCQYCAADQYSKDRAARIVALEAEVKQLQEEIMRRDTLPDFERGEYAGQDAMLRHIALLKEDSNSQLAAAVRACPLVQVRAEILRQAAENLEAASYKLKEPFDPEAAKALHFELSVVQSRAEMYAGKKEE
jgi:hypothetical protein